MGFQIAAPNPITPQGRLIANAITYLSLPGVALLGTVSTLTQAANFVRYFPMLVSTPITIDQLSTEVTSAAAAGKLLRMGIYAADTAWQPMSVVCDTGALAADAVGVVSGSVVAPLAAGRYLLAWNTDGAPTVRTVRGIPANGFLVPTLGANPIVYSLRGTQTFGAFPATGAVIDSVSGNNVGIDYWVFPRVSVP